MGLLVQDVVHSMIFENVQLILMHLHVTVSDNLMEGNFAYIIFYYQNLVHSMDKKRILVLGIR